MNRGNATFTERLQIGGVGTLDFPDNDVFANGRAPGAKQL